MALEAAMPGCLCTQGPTMASDGINLLVVFFILHAQPLATLSQTAPWHVDKFRQLTAFGGQVADLDVSI